MRGRALGLLRGFLCGLVCVGGSADRAASEAVVPEAVVPEPAASVALVGWVSGEVLGLPPAVRDRPQGWRELELLQRLGAGARVRTDEGRVVLVFFDGRRLALEARSEVEIRADGWIRRSGEIRGLAAVPAVTELPRLAEPGRLVAAGRIRQAGPAEGEAERPYPENGALARDAARLTLFGPGWRARGPEVGASSAAADARSRSWQVFDSRGSEVFTAESPEPWVQVPGESLQPGEAYYWRVSEHSGELVASGFFSIPSRAEARARERLRARAEAGEEMDLWVLLAALEARLGLWREACGTLAEAGRRAPAAAGPGPGGGSLRRLRASSGCAAAERSP